MSGNVSSWYHELQTKGKAKSKPWLTKNDLPFNIPLGELKDDQLDCVVEKLVDNFPGVNQGVLFHVLLPEAIIRLCRNVLQISENEVVEYLEAPNEKKIEKMLSNMKKNTEQNTRGNRSSTMKTYPSRQR